MEKEIIKQIDLFYEINREDLTAQIVKSPNAKGDIYIPLFIKYESKDYKIIGIKEDSFKNNRKITSISMPNDSHLQSIGKNAFSFSSITELFLPKEVNNLEDGWCRNVSDLTNVTISPSNKNFKYLDEEHQIIVGKSDTKQEIFDTIIFANRDILYATIPKYIKYIKQGAFEDCKYLFTIEFEKDSELIFIGDYSFSNSFINRITIPKNVCKICEAAFNCCHNLQNVTFEEGSKLVSFESKLFMHNEKLDTVKIPENSALRSIHCDVFNGTKINQLFIPASVERIEDGWCENNSKLEKVTLSPSNKNFRYLDNTHQIIVGKSDPNQCNFDTIIFVNRNIIHAKIPDTIKHIYSYSFENCKKLQKIEFSEDSEIVSLCCDLFPGSSIRSFVIPASIEELEDGWCSNVSDLNIVTISPSNKNFKYLDEEHLIIVGKSDTKQEIFDTIFFASRDIKHIKIPKHIKYIKQNSFERCKYLRTVEFEKDSELISIGINSFAFTAIQSITIPKNVCELGICSFYCCENLKTFSLEEGSKLKSIHKCAVSFSHIEEFFIPKTVEEIEDDWCSYALHLKKVTVSPENKNFKYLDAEHQIFVGKSDKNEDIFDVIVFANRNIKYFQIPKYIKCIKSDAFANCEQLKMIDIPDDSEIDSFGINAFTDTSLVNFRFPRKVCEYENDFLNGSKKIWCIEFLGDFFVDDKNSIFDSLDELILVSFPNVKELSFSNKNFISSQEKFTMFVNAGSKLFFPKF